METDSFKISAQFPVSARVLYQAWLDSKQHARFTGAAAKIKPQVGGTFSAWDGYILGKTVELVPFQHIVQSWRTTEFPQGCPDSIVDITFQDVAGGSKITIKHTQIPKGQGEEYRQGWKQFYFKPMKEFFSGQDK